MPIFDDVSAHLKDAMRARDKLRLAALRSMRAALLNRQKEDNSDALSDADCVAVLRRLERQRRESIEAFQAAGHEERAQAERAELEVIEAYLPRLADEATTREWVREAIQASGASGPADVGRVMGALMKAHKGDVDGGLARRMAAELLAQA